MDESDDNAGDEAMLASTLDALVLDCLLDTTREHSSLTPEQAGALAYSEIKAARRERGIA